LSRHYFTPHTHTTAHARAPRTVETLELPLFLRTHAHGAKLQMSSGDASPPGQYLEQLGGSNANMSVGHRQRYLQRAQCPKRTPNASPCWNKHFESSVPPPRPPLRVAGRHYLSHSMTKRQHADLMPRRRLEVQAPVQNAEGVDGALAPRPMVAIQGGIANARLAQHPAPGSRSNNSHGVLLSSRRLSMAPALQPSTD
jgi:hypothetical protein